MQPQICPVREELLAYLLGKLPDDTSDIIATHVDRCAHCQTVLPGLSSATDELVDSLRKSPADATDPSDDLLKELLADAIQKQAGALRRKPEAYPHANEPSNAGADGRYGHNPLVTLDQYMKKGADLGQIDQYQLLEEIGVGGMGVVYKAMHTQLEKIVALKVIHPDKSSDAGAMARFQREIKAVGKLDNPHIVRAIDARIANGCHFLVMEYIAGVDLAKLLASCHPLRVQDVCEEIRQAALGLQHAHEHGLVHRDVKPSNLILSKNGQVKVLDLGLARLESSTPSGLELTTPGEGLGTLYYIAPEQAKDASSVDIRADIYSLGCGFYHLLSGHPPFSGPKYSSPSSILLAHMQDPVPPLEAHRQDVPKPVLDILYRMMAKLPADRFATPAAVATALGPFAKGANLKSLASRCLASTGSKVKPDGPRIEPVPDDGEDFPSEPVDGFPAPQPVPPSPRRIPLRAAALVAALLLVSCASLAYYSWWDAHNTSQVEPDPSPDLANNSGKSGHDKENKLKSDLGTRHETEDLASKASGILSKNCGRCHGAGGPIEGGFDYISDVAKLKARKKIVVGDPAKSRLFNLVAAGKMPPEKESPRPSKDDIAALEKWIKEGAPDRTEVAKEPTRLVFKGEKGILTAINDHLNTLAVGDQSYQRYFTLSHLTYEMGFHRAALAKLINSLSWKSGIVLPVSINSEETVFAVDLRKLGWEQHDMWNEIIRDYPYGLKHKNNADEETARLAQSVYEKTGVDLPYLRADWFVVAASRPPLYHTLLYECLLGLPKSMHAGDLEAKLGVDVRKNFQSDKLVRAGFTRSGISGQNRLVERHETIYGAYWKSYDFEPNNAAGNLFRFPLGPNFPEHPFPGQAFKQNGGEIIFNLPNGLQGYLLVDGMEQRIDEARVELVSDSLRTAGTAKVVNALSCIGCHQHGMKSGFQDEVRSASSVGGDLLEKVRQLYVKPEAFQALLQKDEERFLNALDKCAGKFLRRSYEPSKSIRDFDEPIGRVARLFLLHEIGLEEAALELGLTDAKELQIAIQANDLLQQFGLGPLIQGNAIKRETWESLRGLNSPFQEAASALRRGTPLHGNK